MKAIWKFVLGLATVALAAWALDHWIRVPSLKDAPDWVGALFEDQIRAIDKLLDHLSDLVVDLKYRR